MLHGYIVNIKTKDVHKDTANNVERRFDTSNYRIKRPLPIGENKSVMGWMKNELDEKIYYRLSTVQTKNIFLFNGWWWRW